LAQLSLLAADRHDAAAATLWAAEARHNLAASQNEERVTAVATFFASARADLVGGARDAAWAPRSATTSGFRPPHFPGWLHRRR